MPGSGFCGGEDDDDDDDDDDRDADANDNEKIMKIRLTIFPRKMSLQSLELR